MNKSYTSIWNEALGAWVAASEAVSARGKASKGAVVRAQTQEGAGGAPRPGRSVLAAAAMVLAGLASFSMPQSAFASFVVNDTAFGSVDPGGCQYMDGTSSNPTWSACSNFSGYNNTSQTNNVVIANNNMSVGGYQYINGITTGVQTTNGNGVGLNITASGAGIRLNNGQISGLAKGSVGSASTDAINGSQLYSVSSSLANALGGGSAVNADGTVSAPSYTVGGTTVNSVGGAIANLDGRVTTNATNIAGNTDAITNLTTNVNNGTVGLVQQAAAGADLTVGKATDGVAVDFADRDGNTRTLKNVTAGSVQGVLVASHRVQADGRNVARAVVRVGNAVVTGSTWTYQDGGLDNGETYSYTVRVEDAGGNPRLRGRGRVRCR
ncbi:ESPR-type extended signal peptide-containing protein [Variovorax sp. J31P216]|nr:ESPR-type extended signal peptide-containing protein [Variovorax sp. J31P216]MDM0027753.1 ESPR-type extended signal peptide-containing protein [Variovorax sp. J31P216]